MTKQTPKEQLLKLTERELDVLRLYCQHKTQKEISKELWIKINTVKTHVSNICEKLEIETSDPGERKLVFFNTYCPLLSENKEDTPSSLNKKESKEPSIEDYEKEESNFQSEEKENEKQDAEAVSEEEQSNNGGNEKVRPKKKRGCSKYISTLVLGALIIIGIWFAWENFLKDIPIVQSVAHLINPDIVFEEDTSGSSKSESIIESILPNIVKYADAYEMGDWVKQDDVWVRLYDYEVSRGTIKLNLEIWNKTGGDIYFSWAPEQNFSMTDNKKNHYQVSTSYTCEESVENDERLNFTVDSFDTVRFYDDPLYDSEVTDLYITMEYLSKIDKAVFHIDMGN